MVIGFGGMNHYLVYVFMLIPMNVSLPKCYSYPFPVFTVKYRNLIPPFLLAYLIFSQDLLNISLVCYTLRYVPYMISVLLLVLSFLLLGRLDLLYPKKIDSEIYVYAGVHCYSIYLSILSLLPFC